MHCICAVIMLFSLLCHSLLVLLGFDWLGWLTADRMLVMYMSKMTLNQLINIIVDAFIFFNILYGWHLHHDQLAMLMQCNYTWISCNWLISIFNYFPFNFAIMCVLWLIFNDIFYVCMLSILSKPRAMHKTWFIKHVLTCIFDWCCEIVEIMVPRDLYTANPEFWTNFEPSKERSIPNDHSVTSTNSTQTKVSLTWLSWHLRDQNFFAGFHKSMHNRKS